MGTQWRFPPGARNWSKKRAGLPKDPGDLPELIALAEKEADLHSRSVCWLPRLKTFARGLCLFGKSTMGSSLPW